MLTGIADGALRRCDLHRARGLGITHGLLSLDNALSRGLRPRCSIFSGRGERPLRGVDPLGSIHSGRRDRRTSVRKRLLRAGNLLGCRRDRLGASSLSSGRLLRRLRRRIILSTLGLEGIDDRLHGKRKHAHGAGGADCRRAEGGDGGHAHGCDGKQRRRESNRGEAHTGDPATGTVRSHVQCREASRRGARVRVDVDLGMEPVEMTDHGVNAAEARESRRDVSIDAEVDLIAIQVRQFCVDRSESGVGCCSVRFDRRVPVRQGVDELHDTLDGRFGVARVRVDLDGSAGLLDRTTQPLHRRFTVAHAGLNLLAQGVHLSDRASDVSIDTDVDRMSSQLRQLSVDALDRPARRRRVDLNERVAGGQLAQLSTDASESGAGLRGVRADLYARRRLLNGAPKLSHRIPALTGALLRAGTDAVTDFTPEPVDVRTGAVDLVADGIADACRTDSQADICGCEFQSCHGDITPSRPARHA